MYIKVYSQISSSDTKSNIWKSWTKNSKVVAGFPHSELTLVQNYCGLCLRIIDTSPN